MTTPPLTFLAPTATWYGAGTATRIGEGLEQLLGVPAGPLLVAVDPVLATLEPFHNVVAGLEAVGYVPSILRDFGPELTNRQVDAAAEVARKKQVGAVIGFGGGSVLDAAKMIALLTVNGGVSDDWYGITTPADGRCGLVLVPTTVGTGAEVTRISMITSGGEKRIASSTSFVPDLVVLDEELVASLPAPVVASTALDALAHAAEALMSTTANPLTEGQAAQAIELVVTNIRQAYEGDRAARGRLLQGAYHAGLALNSGVVLGHSLGYAINHEKPLPHGTTTGLALAYTIAYNQNLGPDTARLLAQAITGDGSASMRDVAEAVMGIIKAVDQPRSLDEAGVPVGVEEEMARRTVELYPRPTNPEAMDRDRVLALVHAMRSGDLDAAFDVTVRKD